jgi:hypothetical protein
VWRGYDERIAGISLPDLATAVVGEYREVGVDRIAPTKLGPEGAV